MSRFAKCTACGEDVCLDGSKIVKTIAGIDTTEWAWTIFRTDESGKMFLEPEIVLHNTVGYKMCLNQFLDSIKKPTPVSYPLEAKIKLMRRMLDFFD